MIEVTVAEYEALITLYRAYLSEEGLDYCPLCYEADVCEKCVWLRFEGFDCAGSVSNGEGRSLEQESRRIFWKELLGLCVLGPAFSVSYVRESPRDFPIVTAVRLRFIKGWLERLTLKAH